jgi:hypothetical protein
MSEWKAAPPRLNTMKPVSPLGQIDEDPSSYSAQRVGGSLYTQPEVGSNYTNDPVIKPELI